jgi:hypothetical protein
MAKEKIFPKFSQILFKLATSKFDSYRFEAIQLILNIFKGENFFNGLISVF